MLATYILFTTLFFNDGTKHKYIDIAGLSKEQCIYHAKRQWQGFYAQGMDKWGRLDAFCQSKEKGRVVEFFHYKCDAAMNCVEDKAPVNDE